MGDYEITLKYSDGILYGKCTFKITVTYAGGVLIWKPSEVPVELSNPLKAAILKTGKSAQVVEDLSLYPDLSKFTHIFMVMGVFPQNHVVQESEIASMKLYLNGMGKLYMEGSETFTFDNATSLHSYFKVNPLNQVVLSNIDGPFKGLSQYADAGPTSWNVSQDYLLNVANYSIEAKTEVLRTKTLLKNDGVDKISMQVGHDDKAVGYRTLASTAVLQRFCQGPTRRTTCSRPSSNSWTTASPIAPRTASAMTATPAPKTAVSRRNARTTTSACVPRTRSLAAATANPRW